jgi:hypothetical protein
MSNKKLIIIGIIVVAIIILILIQTNKNIVEKNDNTTLTGDSDEIIYIDYDQRAETMIDLAISSIEEAGRNSN